MAGKGAEEGGGVAVDDSLTMETEDVEAVRQLLQVRARRALLGAPDLAFHLRFEATPLDGRTERGVAVPVERTPILSGLVDAADELYAVLHSWVDYFRGANPDVIHPGWRADRYGEATVIGLPANISPEGARAMVKVLVLWLQQRELTVFEHTMGPVFQDEVAALVWRLRAANRLTKVRDRVVSVRPCPVCGEFEVAAEFFGEPFTAAERRGDLEVMVATADERRDPTSPAGRRILSAVAGVGVRCGHCGWRAEPRAGDIVRWLA